MSHIPEDFPQFNKERALIAITGTRAANFFSAHDGIFEEKGMIEMPRERYSDDEGFFMRMARGLNLGSGSAKEPISDKLDIRFIKEFHQKMMQMLDTGHYDKIYLFSPDYMGKRIIDDLPSEIKPLINYIGHGNYLKRPTGEILEMIKNE